MRLMKWVLIALVMMALAAVLGLAGCGGGIGAGGGASSSEQVTKYEFVAHPNSTMTVIVKDGNGNVQLSQTFTPSEVAAGRMAAFIARAAMPIYKQ